MYKLEHGDYAYYNKKQLKFMTHHVSVLVSISNGVAQVTSHGEPHKVLIRYEQDSASIEHLKLDIDLIVLTGRFPIDELNEIISGESSTLKTLVGKKNGKRKSKS